MVGKWTLNELMNRDVFRKFFDCLKKFSQRDSNISNDLAIVFGVPQKFILIPVYFNLGVADMSRHEEGFR